MGKLSRVFAVFCVVLSMSAWADKAVDEAKVRFKRGADLYDEGNYRAALIEFDRAHQLLPNYKILYNIAQVHLQLLEYARAQENFQRYLKEGGADVTASRRDEVNKELDRLKTRVGRIALTTTEGAEVLMDDESIGFAPFNSPIVANTGRHKITVVAPGRPPQSRVIEVAGLETTTLAFAQEPSTVAPPTTAGSTGSTTTPVAGVRTGPPQPKSKTPMIIGWAATGVLGITGGIFAGLAFGAEGDLKKQKATLGVTQATLNGTASRISGLGAAADIFGVAAIIAGGVSLFLTVNALSSEDVAVAIGPGGVSVFARF